VGYRKTNRACPQNQARVEQGPITVHIQIENKTRTKQLGLVQVAQVVCTSVFLGGSTSEQS